VGLIIVIVFIAAVYAGPGESGKSTIFKQMKIIQIGGGFSQNELLAYRYIVYGNCITQMKVIVAAAEKLGIEFESPDTKVRQPSVDHHHHHHHHDGPRCLLTRLSRFVGSRRASGPAPCWR